MKVKLSTVLATLFFYPVFLSISLILILILILVGIVQKPFQTIRKTQRMIRLYIRFYGKIVIRLGFPWVRVRYEDKEKESLHPCIYICNHRSASDPFLMAVLPGEFVQVVNTWPFKLPIYGIFARLAGYLNIKRMPIESFLEHGKELLAQGVAIVGFPEGTRSTSLKMGPFHGAMFRLALMTRVPIIPICLSGTERVPPKKSFLIYPTEVKVRKLPAISYHTYKDMSPFKLKTYVHDIIEKQLLEMDSYCLSNERK